MTVTMKMPQLYLTRILTKKSTILSRNLQNFSKIFTMYRKNDSKTRYLVNASRSYPTKFFFREVDHIKTLGHKS